MDKASAVREMFGKIAARYDAANTAMTGGIDAIWRKQAARAISTPPNGQILDLCCGTGALTRLLAPKVPEGKVVGVDFSEPMLSVARKRPERNVEYVQADVLQLPYAAETFDAAAMAFSLRNIIDIPACLREIARVLKPGGAFVNLEVSKPGNKLLRRSFEAYFYGVVPVIGGMIGGDAAAYRYLPQSLINFPDSVALEDTFRHNGFPESSRTPLLGGVACLHIGRTQADAHAVDAASSSMVAVSDTGLVSQRR